jgi:thiamine-phosphate pyrophosphorylase
MTHLRGLYAITLAGLPENLPNRVTMALSGGARLVQYCIKTGDWQHRLAMASMLRDLCLNAGAMLIVNDDSIYDQQSNGTTSY